MVTQSIENDILDEIKANSSMSVTYLMRKYKLNKEHAKDILAKWEIFKQKTGNLHK